MESLIVGMLLIANTGHAKSIQWYKCMTTMEIQKKFNIQKMTIPELTILANIWSEHADEDSNNGISEQETCDIFGYDLTKKQAKYCANLYK